MTLRRALARSLLAGCVLAAGLVAAAPPAQASFHLMEVQEVFAGTNSQVEADFVELEMRAAAQNFVAGHRLSLYSAGGSRTDCTIPANVPNGTNGGRILFATTQFEVEYAVDADFTMPPLLHGDGGAACFENIDCVAWGSFSTTTPSPAGSSFPSGINPGMSLDRIADTNDSQNDFTQIDPPTAEHNAGSLGALSCQPAAADYSLQDLKAKVRARRVTISGRIEPPALGQQVKMTFLANGSPLRKVATKSATLNAAGEFRKRFKVPSDSTRCKIVLRFQGSKLGQKKFRC